MSAQLLFAALVAGSLYALVALGLNLVYGTLRLLNIAHGDLVMIGAYVSFWMLSLFGLPPVLSIFVAAALCGGFGWVIYVGMFRKLLATPALAQRLEANSLILFYGVSVILQNCVALAFTSTARGYQYLNEVHKFAGIAASGNRLMLFGVALALCLGMLLFLRFHLFGWSLRAVIERRDAAAVVGVDVDRVQMVTICIGFAIAGVAGVLVSMTEQITPFMGFPFTIAAFVVIVLGGLGNIFAGIVAGFALGFIETFGVALTSATYRSILIYGLFVGVLLLRPQGLFGKAIKIR
ncbi:branched-chain amino acid ABC transporter permease [Mesorhizobium sp. CGMCC 1.15528]|uniref:Branched-chain amino acid ABC transporter permease n=1 Tax=Mesorhizobium zhangyense TaxID=1776730 RepID=A0A7C9VHH9_9HYPH|nr:MULTISPECIES: branched-chain amino acid ABC transporter permease [Mesorhizobium]NGN44671.1 branched-chain amino acid ABC transporter permease [Mesorhizobium zhangyense]SFU18928.1 amino acid/amide ABC transporter membrane protein 1, HAAT family [Mesorhizobium sp. YR577]